MREPPDLCRRRAPEDGTWLRPSSWLDWEFWTSWPLRHWCMPRAGAAENRRDVASSAMAGEHSRALERSDYEDRESIHVVTKENEMIDYRRVLHSLVAGSAPALGLVLMVLLLREPSLVRATTAADTRYVGTDGVDTGNDCTAMASPCRTVQHALDKANLDDEILVATGIYTGVQARNSMTQVVYISQTVALRGGYSSGFALRDPVIYPTTLDAEKKGRVVTIYGASTGATLDGFTITGGDATGVTANCPPTVGQSDGCGGGLFVYGAHPAVVNNVVAHNVAGVSTPNRSVSGGGLCLYFAAGSVISGNLVISNTASLGGSGAGGGMDLQYPYGVLVMANQVLSNTATTHGTLAGFGGGLSLGGSGSAATIEGNRIEGNRTNGGGTGNGAGVYLWNGLTGFFGNRVARNAGGDAVYLGYSQSLVEANQVVDNSTQAGVRLRYNQATHGPTLINNVIARSGDSVAVSAAANSPLTATLFHNTLAGSGTSRGVNVESGYVTLLLTNTIVAHHAWGITNTVPASSSVVADHTLFWANTHDGVEGNNPMFGNPAFRDPGGSDYHLGPGSAAVDAAIGTGVTVDIDGDARPIGLWPDIGADEAWKWVLLPVVLRYD
jgi:hypothetical protein